MFLLFYYFIFYMQRHDFKADTFTRLAACSSDLYLMSLSWYFIHICKLLISINEKFAHLFYYISKIVNYFFCLAVIVRSILIYINLPMKWIANIYFDGGFYYRNIIVPFEFIIDSISFIILSMCFIFSSISTFLTSKQKKGLLICIFLFPVMCIIALNLRIYSTASVLAMYINKSLYLFTFILLIHRYCVDYLILIIINIISIQADQEEIYNVTHPNEFVLALDVWYIAYLLFTYKNE